MSYELAVVPITSIDLGDRRREDYGDIDMLAKTFDLSDGMMHPIYVKRATTAEGEERYALIGGGRRFMAALLRKEPEIPVRIASRDMDEATMRLLELVENGHRKDFDWKEQVKLEQEVHQLHMEKEKDWNQERTAELLGKKPSAISESLQMARLLAAPECPDMFKNCANMNEARTVFGKLKKDAQRTALVKAHKLRTEIEQANGHKAAGTQPSLAHLADNYVVADALVSMKKLQPDTFDFIEIDPPYGINYDEKSSTTTYTEVADHDYEDFISTVCSEAFRVAKPDAFLCLWMPIQRYTQNFNALTRAGWKVAPCPLVWNKPGSASLGARSLHLARGYEVAFYAHKGVPKLNIYGHPDVFTYPTVPPTRRIHSTERPLELMKEVLSVFCSPGAFILVPFLGSGVTIAAASASNMTAIGFDLSEQHRNNFIVKVTAGWSTYHNSQLSNVNADVTTKELMS